MTHVQYQYDHRFPIAVVRLHGTLTSGDGPQLRQAVLGSLVEEPTSVIVDLAGVTRADDAAVQVFAQLADGAARWPDASLLLCGARAPVAAVLHRALADGKPLQYSDYAAALAVAAAEPVPLRIHRRLEPTVHAPRTARELAAEACAEWALPGYVVPLEILTSELVTNAVQHAGTAIDVRVTLRGAQLRVSVQDGDESMVRRQTPGESDDEGRGLLIVESVAAQWGSQAITHGKVVWAALDVAPQPTGPTGTGRGEGPVAADRGRHSAQQV